MQKSKISYFIVVGLPLFFIVATSILTASGVNAEVYKWTDENGKIHYSDKPLDTKSQKVQIKNQPSKEQVLEAKRRQRSIITHQRKVQEIANDEAKDKKRMADKLDAEEKKRLAFCANATSQIRLMGRGHVTYTKSEDGSRTYLSDKDKNESIAKLKEEMKKRCN